MRQMKPMLKALFQHLGYSSGGIEPRAFDIDATGQYLIVAKVFINTVSQFKRNKETGVLTPTHVALQIGLPTDIKFISK